MPRALGATLARLLVGLGLDDLLAAVVAAGADVVAAMRLARSPARRASGGRGEEVVRAMHAALRRRLLVLLDCHDCLLSRAIRRFVDCVAIHAVAVAFAHRGALAGSQLASCRGANGSVSSNSSSTSATGSSGAFASTTSSLAVGVELRQRRPRSRASSSVVDCCTGRSSRPEAALALQRHVALDRHGRAPAGPAASAVPRMRHAIGPRHRPPLASASRSSSRSSVPRRRAILRARRATREPERVEALVTRPPHDRSRVPSLVRPIAHAHVGRASANRRIIAALPELSKNRRKNNGQRPPLVLASTSRYRRALLERLRCAVRGRRARESTRRRLPASAGGHRAAPGRSQGARGRSAATTTRSSSAPTRWPTATAWPSASPATMPTRSRSCARSPAARSCSTPASRCVDAASGAAARCVDVASTFRTLTDARDRGLSRARAALRLRGRGEVRGARHRAVRAHRKRRSDRADRPAADRADANAAREGLDVLTPRGMTHAGTLYLVPNLLGVVPPADVLPARTIDIARALVHWVVETPKPARAFLKSLAPGTADRELDDPPMPASATMPRSAERCSRPRATAKTSACCPMPDVPASPIRARLVVAAAHARGSASCRWSGRRRCCSR